MPTCKNLPPKAFEAAFGLQRRTVQQWVEPVGQHREAIHLHFVAQPCDLWQVQDNELRVKTQRGASGWHPGRDGHDPRVVGRRAQPTRDQGLIRAMVARILACALPGPLLVVSDGLVGYGGAFYATFRTLQGTGLRATTLGPLSGSGDRPGGAVVLEPPRRRGWASAAT